MIRLAYLTALLITITACSSTPEKIKLYSLSIPESAASTSNNNTIALNKPVLHIAPAKLADYLNTRNMIIQSNQYQVNNARYHLWAEDLDRAIARTLLNKLQPLNNKYILTNTSTFKKNKEQYTLQLEFSAFHATDHSQVIAKGKYWLLDKNQKMIVLKNFDYALTLEQDGYLHSVKKLNETLDMLANDIISSIQH